MIICLMVACAARAQSAAASDMNAAANGTHIGNSTKDLETIVNAYAVPSHLSFGPHGVNSNVLEMVLGYPEGGITHWFTNVYQKRWWHSHDEVDDVSADDELMQSIFATPIMTSIQELFDSATDTTLVNAITIRSDGGEVEEREPPKAQAEYIRQLLDPDSSADASMMANHIAGGGSVTFKLDRLPSCLVQGPDPTAPPPPLIGLHRKVSKAFGGIAISTTLWITGGKEKTNTAGSRMHAAPHDRIVVQLSGRKVWQLCIPTGQMVLPVVNMPVGYEPRHSGGELPDAITAALHDIFIRSQRPAWTATANPGSASWSGETGEKDGIDYEALYRGFPLSSIDFASQMKCTKIELAAGDRLYLPAGILHKAEVLAGSGRDATEPSVHLTFGLQKFGITWGDFILSVLSNTPAALGAANSDRNRKRKEHEQSATLSALWRAGTPGNPRRRTGVEAGTCDFPVACGKVEQLLFKTLRASAVTNGPLALTTESSLLANMVPMWTTQSIGAVLVDHQGASADNGKGQGDLSFIDVLEQSDFFAEYQSLVTGPMVAQLFASTNEAAPPDAIPEVARSDADGNHIHMYRRNSQGPPTGTTYAAVAKLQAELLLPASVAIALLQLKQIPDFTVNEEECGNQR